MLNRVVWFIFSLLPLHFLFKQVCADLSAEDGGGGRNMLQLSLVLVNQNVGKNVLNLSRLS